MIILKFGFGDNNCSDYHSCHENIEHNSTGLTYLLLTFQIGALYGEYSLLHGLPQLGRPLPMLFIFMLLSFVRQFFK